MSPVLPGEGSSGGAKTQPRQAALVLSLPGWRHLLFASMVTAPNGAFFLYFHMHEHPEAPRVCECVYVSEVCVVCVSYLCDCEIHTHMHPCDDDTNLISLHLFPNLFSIVILFLFLTCLCLKIQNCEHLWLCSQIA